jgi:hypothetical protein
MTPVSQRRQQQRGFMLLFVFLLAASAALGIYLELPRVAFESQRMREELLVERGLEYRRAIQLHTRKLKKYPQSIEELEKNGTLRFLRRRYIDPMTGKDEWRLIKIGPDGQFIDSLVYKRKNPLESEKQGLQNTFITEQATIGSTGNANGPGQATLGNRMRQSDMAGAAGQQIDPQGAPPAGAVGPNGEPLPPPDPNNPNAQQQAANSPQQQQPGFMPQQPGQVGYPQQQQGFPQQQQQQQQQQYGFPQQPGQQPVGFPQQPGQQPVGFPPQPGQTNAPVGFSPTGQIIPGVGTAPNVGQRGPFNPNSTAASEIMRMISQPRPGGQPGSMNTPFNSVSNSQTGGTVPQQQGGFGSNNTGFGSNNTGISSNPGFGQSQTGFGQNAPGRSSAMGMTGATAGFGAGIAGVASKFEAEGIKIIAEKTRYNEWEFIYDSARDPLVTGQVQRGSSAVGPTNPGNTVGTPSSGFGNSGFGGSGSSFGSGSGNSGFGSPGFGNSGFGNSGSTMPRR